MTNGIRVEKPFKRPKFLFKVNLSKCHTGINESPNVVKNKLDSFTIHNKTREEYLVDMIESNINKTDNSCIR